MPPIAFRLKEGQVGKVGRAMKAVAAGFPLESKFVAPPDRVF